MESSRERILEVLEESPEGLCDDCLSTLTEVTPRQQVNQLCRVLAQKGTVYRGKQTCPACKGTKLVNILQTHVQPSVVRESVAAYVLHETPPREGYISIVREADPGEKLDSIRRNLVRILDSVEGTRSGKQGLAARVSRLRDSSQIPVHVCCFMLTLNTLRNLVVYEGFLPGEHELAVIDEAYAAIQKWWNSRTTAE